MIGSLRWFNVGLTPTTPEYFCVTHGDQRGFFQFKIFIKSLAGSYDVIWRLQTSDYDV